MMQADVDSSDEGSDGSGDDSKACKRKKGSKRLDVSDLTH